MQMGSYGVCPFPVEDSNLLLAFVHLPLLPLPNYGIVRKHG